jgi:hypothetical protein
MALIEDVFKGNLVLGLAVGVGAVIFGPTVVQSVGSVLRPAAKAVIKGGMVFYRETLGEIGEMASDLVAEARAELEQEPHTARETAAPRGKGRAGAGERASA